MIVIRAEKADVSLFTASSIALTRLSNDASVCNVHKGSWSLSRTFHTLNIRFINVDLIMKLMDFPVFTYIHTYLNNSS